MEIISYFFHRPFQGLTQLLDAVTNGYFYDWLPRIENRGVLKQIQNRIQKWIFRLAPGFNTFNMDQFFFPINFTKQSQSEFHRIFITYEIHRTVSDDKILKLNLEEAI